MIRVAILTISDSCAQRKREDISGQTIVDVLPKDRFEVCEKRIVADDHNAIANELKFLSHKVAIDVVLTTGGTGLGPRDVTPEATRSVCERIVPGLSEIIRAEGRKRTKNAILSRGIAAVRNKTLVINLPGSPKGVKESLEVVLDILPHAVDMMLGGSH